MARAGRNRHTAAADVHRISSTLVRAFAFMVENPDRWVSITELSAAAAAPTSTIYRRFSNLEAAGVLRSRCIADFRHFKLAPDWQSVPLALELQRRHLMAK